MRGTRSCPTHDSLGFGLGDVRCVAVEGSEAAGKRTGPTQSPSATRWTVAVWGGQTGDPRRRGLAPIETSQQVPLRGTSVPGYPRPRSGGAPSGFGLSACRHRVATWSGHNKSGPRPRCSCCSRVLRNSRIALTPRETRLPRSTSVLAWMPCVPFVTQPADERGPAVRSRAFRPRQVSAQG